MNIVVYYRTRPNEPEASDTSLAEQKTAVETWIAAHDIAVLADHTEAESEGVSRPALSAALATCKAHSATLVIATTEGIGSGEPFAPRIVSVSVEILRHPPKPLGTTIPLPAGAPDKLALWFRPNGIKVERSVYLCNPGPDSLTDIEVVSVGMTTHVVTETAVTDNSRTETRTEPLATSVAAKSFAILPAARCLLVDSYDPMWDGDFVTPYQVSFKKEGRQRKGQAVVGTGGPDRLWLTLKMFNERG